LVYEGQEPVCGTVEITLPGGKKVDHLGIKIEMIGLIELYYDRGNSVKFTTLVRELETAGTLLDSRTYPFEFSTEKPYESYSGLNVRLRYIIRVTITRNYNGSISKDQDILVQNISAVTQDVSNPDAPAQQPLKMEVGIEDCLHIEFEYDKQKYNLKDVVLGKIFFLLVRIKIKHMELAVIRRESAGSGQNTYNESENITKFELMDGAPVKGEVIPIRLFLSPLPLTPTHRSVNNTFSVKYYLNLVLIDEEDRRYFKQQEIILWRKELH
jgi:vacuolar protein sorting-associated protein 26